MAFNDSSYGLFQGQFFLAERSLNGALLSGFEFVGDVDKFQISPTQKFDDIKESQSGLGLTAAHILTETDVKVDFSVLDIRMSNWIRATWGGAVQDTAGGTVSNEAITLYNGMMTPLKHGAISGLTVSGAVAGTDYIVDTVNGTLTVPATSTTIPQGSPMSTHASYTYAASNGRVEAFVTGQRYYTGRLQGRNTAQGNQPVIVTCLQIAFDMAKALSMIEKKHVGFDMGGMLLQDTSVPLPQSVNDFSQFFAIQKA